jgi:hypothetical protein
LLSLQARREPFDVITGKRFYRNMMFKSLTQITDRYTDNVLSITATLQEITIVSVDTATVPARDKQKNPAKTGQTEKAGSKSAQPLPENQTGSQRKSALETLING